MLYLVQEWLLYFKCIRLLNNNIIMSSMRNIIQRNCQYENAECLGMGLLTSYQRTTQCHICSVPCLYVQPRTV